MKILITGPSGSGKTTLSSRARDFGYNAYDTDVIAGLAAWHDAQGNRVIAPRTLDSEFLDSHQFIWCAAAIEQFLGMIEDFLLFGIARNAFDFAHHFDRIYFLKVPDEILATRLISPFRNNPMGQQPHHIEYCLRWAAINEARAQSVGALFLDGTNSPDSLLAEIAVNFPP